MKCPSCRTENPSDSRYCAQCGSAIADSSPTLSYSPAEVETVAASLRSVTGCSAGSRTNRNDDSFTLDGAVEPRAVIVVTGENALPMQTIRYRVANGALERIINGNPQTNFPKLI